jgi:hypothetical protein
MWNMGPWCTTLCYSMYNTISPDVVAVALASPSTLMLALDELPHFERDGCAARHRRSREPTNKVLRPFRHHADTFTFCIFNVGDTNKDGDLDPGRADFKGFTHQVSLLVLYQLAVEGNKCACFSNCAGIYSASWQLSGCVTMKCTIILRQMHSGQLAADCRLFVVVSSGLALSPPASRPYGQVQN